METFGINSSIEQYYFSTSFKFCSVKDQKPKQTTTKVVFEKIKLYVVHSMVLVFSVRFSLYADIFRVSEGNRQQQHPFTKIVLNFYKTMMTILWMMMTILVWWCSQPIASIREPHLFHVFGFSFFRFFCFVYIFWLQWWLLFKTT